MAYYIGKEATKKPKRSSAASCRDLLTNRVEVTVALLQDQCGICSGLSTNAPDTGGTSASLGPPKAHSNGPIIGESTTLSQKRETDGRALDR